jgi:hypothetical protein
MGGGIVRVWGSNKKYSFGHGSLISMGAQPEFFCDGDILIIEYLRTPTLGTRAT